MATAPAASIAAATAAKADANHPPDPDPSPWDEIEHNYFTSMRLHREQEDATLEANFAKTADALKTRLINNYAERCELLRRVQVLRDEYEAGHAELAQLGTEVEAVREARRMERVREDEERRAWFRTFRRGGLAYRQLEKEGPKVQDERTEATTRAVDAAGTSIGADGEYREPETPDVGLAINGHDREKQDGGTFLGIQHTEGYRTPYVEDDGLTEDKMPVAQYAQQSQLAPGQREPSGTQEDAYRTSFVEDSEMTEDELPATQQEQQSQASSVRRELADQGVQEGDAGIREAKMLDAEASAVTGQVEEPHSTETEMETAGHEEPASGQQPTYSHLRPLMDDDDRLDGIPVIGGPELPQDLAGLRNNRDHDTNPTFVLSEEPASMLESPAERDTNATSDTGVTEQAALMQNAEILGGEALRSSETAADHEMEDAHTATVHDVHPMEGPAVPVSSDFPRPVSSSSSSELSSRHTTPELDVPLSPAKGPSQPSSPEDVATSAIDVLSDSGELIGRVEPLDMDSDNHFLERIMGLPIQRPVRIRPGRKFTVKDLDAIPHPQSSDTRPFKLLSLYIQATGEPQEVSCMDCSMDHGFFQGCVAVDDGDFTRCGNCEWNKRGCLGITIGTRSELQSPTRAHAARGSFTSVNSTPSRRLADEDTEAEVSNKQDAKANGADRKGPRKSLPSTRKAPRPSTPLNASFQEAESLPEINKESLCLRDDGVVFTDPPLMRGVPLTKITPDHPYWDKDWVPVEKLVEPILQKHQAKYDQLEQSGSTHRDKHLANRDAKRGRTILQFLQDGELHPYQLVGKDYITPKLTHYDTLFRLAQLLTEELPKMNLDITPSEWLRQRLHEKLVERGEKYNLAAWLEKAYHDPKLEQLRAKNGFARVGRPPAHASKKGGTEPGSSSKKTAPRSLKRKGPHATPQATPSKSKPSPGPTAGGSAHPPKAKKIKVVNAPGPRARVALDETGLQDDAADADDALAFDGYTSTDSISRDKLQSIDWRLHQVKTRTFASNAGVTQYWHWVDHEDPNLIEHQVLRSVKPVKWSVFKDPYNFHLHLSDIHEVAFAVGNTRIAVMHKEGRDGRDLEPRGDVMAQFKRDRTKRRFLSDLKRKGVKVVQVSSDHIDTKWITMRPETLAAGDSSN